MFGGGGWASIPHAHSFSREGLLCWGAHAHDANRARRLQRIRRAALQQGVGALFSRRAVRGTCTSAGQPPCSLLHISTCPQRALGAPAAAASRSVGPFAHSLPEARGLAAESWQAECQCHTWCTCCTCTYCRGRAVRVCGGAGQARNVCVSACPAPVTPHERVTPLSHLRYICCCEHCCSRPASSCRHPRPKRAAVAPHQCVSCRRQRACA